MFGKLAGSHTGDVAGADGGPFIGLEFLIALVGQPLQSAQTPLRQR